MLYTAGRLFKFDAARRPTILITALALATFIAQGQPLCNAQDSQSSDTVATSDPVFLEYKGVRIGMSADEARKKLGSPSDKGEQRDFFVISSKESAQVFYDKSKNVFAISVIFIGGGSSVPSPKAVLGSEVQAKADGSLHRLVRYPKAGCWVSYNRTGGDSPLVTVTMQRMEEY